MRVARIEPFLRALTALFVIIALVALFWRPALPQSEIAPAGLGDAPTARSADTTSDPGTAQTIIAGNMFSPSRTAPRSRYNPFEPAPAAPSFSNGFVAAPTVSEEDVVPRLFGVVIGPGGASALMRLDPTQPEAQLYRTGDSAGGYQVVNISEQSVILKGPRGQLTLQLKRPEGSTP